MDYRKQFAIYHRVEGGKGERTISAYLADVRRFRAWLDENAPVPWEQVQTRHLRAYMAWLSDDRLVTREDGSSVLRKAVGAKYINRVTSSLREWFSYLERVEKVIEGNPTAELKKAQNPQAQPGAFERVGGLEVDSSGGQGLTFARARAELDAHRCLVSHGPARLGAVRHERARHPLQRRAAQRRQGHRQGQQRANGAAQPGGLEGAVQLAARTGAHRGRRADRGGYVVCVADSVWAQTGASPDAGTGCGSCCSVSASSPGLQSLCIPTCCGTRLRPRPSGTVRRFTACRRALGHASIATTGIYLHADEEELEQVAGVLPSVLGKAYREAAEREARYLELED